MTETAASPTPSLGQASDLPADRPQYPGRAAFRGSGAAGRARPGRAYGFTSLGWTIGVVLGGLIVTRVSWRWTFWINVPTGILAIARGAAGAARQGRADAFTTGLHAAFYASVSFMVLAAILSALRGGQAKKG